MPSITVSRSRNTIGEKSGTITITPSGFSLPTSSDTIRYSNMQYQYKVDNNSWSSNNVISISKSSTTSQQAITAYCRITYTKEVYEYVPPVYDPITGALISEGYYRFVSSSTEYGSPVSKGLTLYFHPGVFNMGATQNALIKDVLTEETVNKWAEHFQEAYHWHNQKSDNYIPATQTYPNNKKGLRVVANNPICAEWFNNCMRAMNIFDNKNFKTAYKGGANGDLISATVINQLNFEGIN